MNGVDSFSNQEVNFTNTQFSYVVKEGQLPLTEFETANIATVASSNESQLATFMRRAADVLISLAAISVGFSFFLLVALAIKLNSRGPVLYSQSRIGLNGAPFNVLKFRTMRSNAETNGPQWASSTDPRVTRVGAFLRKTRIDEFPQFINVLLGSMTLIGPRPERQYFIERIESTVPEFSLRLLIKPGITGWAQINYPYTDTIEDAKQKLAYDLYYIKHRSFAMDIKILLKTVLVVLLGTGAR